MLGTILFYAFSVLTVGSAILTITRRNVVMSAVWLIASLLGVAGLFLLQGAEFLFVAQLILYIGGVVLLILIAYACQRAAARGNISASAKAGRPSCSRLAAGRRAALRFRASRSSSSRGGEPAARQYRSSVADTLFTHYLAGFEVASLILLVAIIGAVVMGQRREENQA